MYKLTNLREFNETLNYCSQQIREKGFFVTDYNTKLKKKLPKKDNRGNKDLWPMYQTKLLKDF